MGPYAYVGPWTPREGPFWNAFFGAVRAATELPDSVAVAAFFADGRNAATRRRGGRDDDEPRLPAPPAR